MVLQSRKWGRGGILSLMICRQALNSFQGEQIWVGKRGKESDGDSPGVCWEAKAGKEAP